MSDKITPEYTPERLRQWADEAEALGASGVRGAPQYRAHAAALEECARLRADILATYAQCMRIVEASCNSGDECCISQAEKTADAISAASARAAK